MMSESLWPDLPREPIRTPHSILLEQASFLGEKTRGLVVGRVTRDREVLRAQPEEEEKLRSTLTIVAPSLNNYSYAVCTITYPISLYPCRLFFHASRESRAVADEADLTAGLRAIFGSKELIRVMTGLLGQIQADEDARPRERVDALHDTDALQQGFNES
jgi:hypothetical protein